MGCTTSKPVFEKDQRIIELVRYTKARIKTRPYSVREAVTRRGYRISQNPLRGYF